MEESRSLGGLKTNSFVRLLRLSGNGRTTIEIEDLGHAEAVLSNRPLLREKVEALRRQGRFGPSERTAGEDGWGDIRKPFARLRPIDYSREWTNRSTDRQTRPKARGT